MPPNADRGSHAKASCVGLGQGVGHRRAARVGVLDDGDRRLAGLRGEVVGEVPRRVGVEDVEVAEGDAGVLLDVVPARWWCPAGGSGHPAGAGSRRSAGPARRARARGGSWAGASPVPGRSRRTTTRPRRRSRRCGRTPCGPGAGGWLRPTRAVGGDLGQHRAVVGRVDDDADVGVVLGRGADHGRAADVDEVDAATVVVGAELAAAGIAGCVASPNG